MFCSLHSVLPHENLYSSKNKRYRKNRLHSRQQPCRSPRLTVIGIGLRKISSKFCLPSVRAARRHCRCLAFRLFLFYYTSLFCVYIFHAESLVCTFAPRCLRNMPADKAPALRHRLRRRGAVPTAATGAERGRRARASGGRADGKKVSSEVKTNR